jgi:hypothetical protein
MSDEIEAGQDPDSDASCASAMDAEPLTQQTGSLLYSISMATNSLLQCCCTQQASKPDLNSDPVPK